MTVQEMHYAVDQGLQKVGSFVYDTFLEEEIDFFLNKMQERFIKDRVFRTSDPKRLGFSLNQKRLDDVRAIIEVDFIDILNTNVSTVVEYQRFDLPVDYLYLINLRARLTPAHCDSTVIKKMPARVVEQDKVYELLRNPFSTSTVNSPVATISSEDITVFQDIKKFILKGVELDYIRKPEKIDLSSSQDCELAEHTHHEIVDMTVKHILEVIESPRYQSNAAEESQSD
jgi:hypothetical protein